MRKLFSLLLALLLLALSSGPAAANMAKPTWYGGVSGVPLPQADHQVSVQAERLTFDLRKAVEPARVTAEYRLHNGADAPVQLPVAFALYTSAKTDLKDARVEMAGRRVQVRPVWLYELLWPRVETWLQAHANLTPLAATVEKLQADEEYEQAQAPDQAMRAAVAATGLEIDRHNEGYRALRKFLVRGAGHGPGDPYESLAAVRLVASGEAAQLEGAWRAGAGRQTWPDPGSGGTYEEDFFESGTMLALLLFDLELPARETRTVRVFYSQQPTTDGIRGVAHFEYLLQPARRWAGFGTLEAEVLLPADWPLTGNLPLQRADRDGLIRYAASFPTLPTEDWLLSVQVPPGTLKTRGYPVTPIVIGLLVIGLLLLVLVVGVPLSMWLIIRAWRKRRRRGPPGGEVTT